jgi:lysyl-tRNA synthetase class 2
LHKSIRPYGTTFRARAGKKRKTTSAKSTGNQPLSCGFIPIDADSKSIKADFSEGKSVTIAGRLMSRRIQGKASFAEVQDRTGKNTSIF